MISFMNLFRKVPFRNLASYSIHTKKLVVIICFLATISACQPKAESESIFTQEGSEFNYTVNKLESPNENFPKLVGVGNEFDITTNNCGSSVNAEESLSRSRDFTINVNTDISEEISGKLGGGIIVAEGEIAAAVAVSFGVELGSTESVNVERKIETPADTISTVALQWEEMWDVGKVSIHRKDGTTVGEVPYRILTTLNLTQNGVQEFPCGTSSPDPMVTIEPVPIHTTEPDPTDTIEPVPTDTIEPVITDLPQSTDWTILDFRAEG